jgi:hypothetical protein
MRLGRGEQLDHWLQRGSGALLYMGSNVAGGYFRLLVLQRPARTSLPLMFSLNVDSTATME